MGMDYCAYQFFGIHVPESKFVTTSIFTEQGWIDGIIKHTPGLDTGGVLGHLMAGPYDQDMFFLVAWQPYDPENPCSGIEVELGYFRQVTEESFDPEWDQLLRRLAEAAGYTGLDDPAWITVPDQS